MDAAQSHERRSGSREPTCAKAQDQKENLRGLGQGSDTLPSLDNKEGSWRLLTIWWCLPCGEHSTVHRNKRIVGWTGGVSLLLKEVPSTLVKMELSLFKGKWKAGVGGLEPDCHWGVHEEGLPRISPSLTQTSHQLWQWSSGRLSCREKLTSYQGKALPWGSALGGTSSLFNYRMRASERHRWRSRRAFLVFFLFI